MQVKAQKLPDEPIIILTISGSSSEADVSEREGRQVYSLFNSVSEPVVLILDVTQAEVELDEIMRGASSVYRGDSPLFRHPNVRQILQVSNNPAFEMAARGLDSEVFGDVKIEVFHTLKEALNYARASS